MDSPGIYQVISAWSREFYYNNIPCNLEIYHHGSEKKLKKNASIGSV